MKKFCMKHGLAVLLLASSSLMAACSEKPAEVVQQGDNFVEVWKTPTCGCCSEWVEHLKENGFTVKVNDVQNTDSFRAALGMPQQYGSCHSAKVAGYAVEGHVPAEDIKKLIAENPMRWVCQCQPCPWVLRAWSIPIFRTNAPSTMYC